MFEGCCWCIDGFKGWRELMQQEAGANRVATLPKFYPAKGWFSQGHIVGGS